MQYRADEGEALQSLNLLREVITARHGKVSRLLIFCLTIRSSRARFAASALAAMSLNHAAPLLAKA